MFSVPDHWRTHFIENTTLLEGLDHSSADVQLITELYLYIYQVMYNK